MDDKRDPPDNEDENEEKGLPQGSDASSDDSQDKSDHLNEPDQPSEESEQIEDSDNEDTDDSSEELSEESLPNEESEVEQADTSSPADNEDTSDENEDEEDEDEEDDEEEEELDTSKTYGRAKTPTILQMENTECGAASLSIILSYYKRFLTLEELRFQCGVSRDGSNVLNIIKAARQNGMKSEGYQYEVDELKHVQTPFIVYWQDNHFLVVEKMGRKKVFLNDPAQGPRKVSYEDFKKAYSEITITATPTDKFEKSGKPMQGFKLIFEYLTGLKKVFIYIFLLGWALVLPTLASAAFSQMFIDEVLEKHYLGWGGWIIFAMFMGSALDLVMKAIQVTVLNYTRVKILIRMASRFVWHVLRLPMHFYAQRFGGEIANRMQYAISVATSLAGGEGSGNLALVLLKLMTGALFGFILFVYDWQIGCVGVFTFIMTIVMFLLMKRLRFDAFAHYQQQYGKSLGVAVNALQSIETVKASGMEGDFFSKWAGVYVHNINAEQNIAKISGYMSIAPHIVQTLASAAVMFIGAVQIIDGKLTIGMLMAVQILLGKFLEPVGELISLGSSIQNIKILTMRIDDVLKNKLDRFVVNELPYNPNEAEKLDGYIELKNVTFGYSPLDPPLIKNLSIKLLPGQRVAFVGFTGSGKSTLAKLILGLYEPWEGEILIDGKKREEIPRSVLNASIAAVDQDIFLFEGTIRENLTLWNKTIYDEDIIQAAKDACIHDDIIVRKQGYDTPISEGGKNLSGGQRQRMEITRALLMNPRILVMDEATSALDSATEATIVENLRRRMCTCVVVAHRLSTIRDSDEIIVLEKGKVSQRGNHESLKVEEGIYKTFIEKEGINA